jgi:hypothetical protein
MIGEQVNGKGCGRKWLYYRTIGLEKLRKNMQNPLSK